MDGVIYLVANDKLIFTACRSFKCFIVGLFGGLLVLNFGNVFGTKFASLIKALATLVIIKLFLKLRVYVFYKSLFASSPIFYELDERHVPAAPQSPCHKTQRGACFTLTLAGIYNHNRFFCLKIL